jgi:holliday junction DNA helicase RuvA
MIGRLKGVLIRKQPPGLLLDVQGVGYELEAPMSTFYELPELGREVILITHLQVKEDGHALFGFINEQERFLFRTLLKVSGIGAKTALAILSGVSAADLHRIVQSGDSAALVRIPGIGKKTADRLLLELRDRLHDSLPASLGGREATAMATAQDPRSEAHTALLQFGYKPPEIARLLKDVDEGDSAEAMIRKALKAALR